jgi:hypothetical protein
VDWDKRKDVMWIDWNWLDDNLKAFLWGGKCNVRFPGVRWLCFDEGTMSSFVKEGSVSWVDVETVFIVQERGLRWHAAEIGGWEDKFGKRKGKGLSCRNCSLWLRGRRSWNTCVSGKFGDSFYFRLTWTSGGDKGVE